MAALIASGNCSHMRVEPSRSVIRKVTVPVGRSPAIDANPLIAGYKDFSVAADLLGSCELSQSIGGLAAAGRDAGARMHAIPATARTALQPTVRAPPTKGASVADG